MKKSEMVKILQRSIHKHCQDMECCITEEETFIHILQDLEAAGMLPPAYNNKNTFNQDYMMNKWEDDA